MLRSASVKSPVRSSQFMTARAAAEATTSTQTSMACQPSSGRTQGRVRARKRSGSMRGKTHGQGRGQKRDDPPAPALEAALVQVREIEDRAGLEQVGAVQAGQEVDDLVLGGHVVAQALAGRLPDLVQGAAPIHHAHQLVGLGGKAVVPARESVLDDVPVLTAVLVPIHVHVAAQARLQRRHAVPGRAQQRYAHDASRLRAATSTGTGSATRACPGPR